MVQTLDTLRREAADAAFKACKLSDYQVTEVDPDWDIGRSRMGWTTGSRAVWNDGSGDHLRGSFTVEFEADSAKIQEITASVNGRTVESHNEMEPKTKSVPTTAIGYDGKFACWSDVTKEFDTDMPEPEEVLLAVYETGGYDGDALVVYRNGDRYSVVTGGHCSCYGLEGQFDPEDYDLTLFKGVVERWFEASRGSLSQFYADRLLADLRTRYDPNEEPPAP